MKDRVAKLFVKPGRSWRWPLKAATCLIVLRCLVATAQAATAVDEALYSSLHPFYTELCADSQILKKPGFGADIRGGIGGRGAEAIPKFHERSLAQQHRQGD